MTFSTPAFCTRCMSSTSLAVNERSYFILSTHRPVTDVGVLMRLHGCQVMNTYRNCHQGINTPNAGGVAHFQSS